MNFKVETAVWEITFRCNMNCIHCGSDCTSIEKEYQLTTPECFRVIEDLADIGCGTVILSGGEPLLREDVGAIATHIKRCKMRVAFISNGYLVNDETIKLIKAIDPVAYGISLDSSRPEIHDYIRGKKDAFAHVERAIKLLHKNNIPPSIVTTVHKLNFEDLEGIRKFLIKNKVRLWQIQYGDHIGRMPKETMLTEAQFFEVGKFILETQQKYGKYFDKIAGADVMGYMGELATKIQGPWWGCHAGLKGLGLGSDGSVRGCLSLQMDQYIEGNVRERSLKEIWNDPNSFKYNRSFECSMLTGYCKTCEYASVCKGGCLRSATVEGGRCNPYCLYKIEKDGFSSPEQARINFSREELYNLYNPLRALPENYLK